MSTYEVIEGGVTVVPSLVIDGAGGSGYLNMPSQGSEPVVPTTNTITLYSDSANAFSWKNPAGYSAAINTSGLTASRTYTLPDATDTLVGQNTPMVLQNKTVLSTDGNIVEASNIAGFNIVGPFSNGDTLKYNTGTSQWNALTLAATTPLTYSNGNFGVTVGSVAGSVAAGNDLRFSTPNLLYVKKIAGAGEFTSINAAIAAVTSPGPSNPWMILVGPGVYVENAIVLPSYVQLCGSGMSTIVVPSSNSITLLTMMYSTTLHDIVLKGLGGTGTGILVDSKTNVLVMTVMVRDFNECICTKATTAPTDAYFHEVSCVGTYSRGVHVDGRAITGAFSCRTSMTIWRSDCTPTTTYGIIAEGPNAFMTLNSVRVINATAGTAIYVADGCNTEIANTKIENCNYGFTVANVGAGCLIKTRAVMVLNSITRDVWIESPATTGNFSGIADRDKVVVDPDAYFSLSYNDIVNGGITITGGLYFNPNVNGVETETGSSLIYPAGLGTYNGGDVIEKGGTTVIVEAGVGYVKNLAYPNEYLEKVQWNETALDLKPNQSNYIYIDDDSHIHVATSAPNQYNTILLARVRTSDSEIEFIDKQIQNNYHAWNKQMSVARNVFGVLYSTGSIVSDNGARQLSISSGLYYYLDNEYTPSGQDFPAKWYAYYHSGGVWTYQGQDLIDNKQYDDGTDLVNIPPGNYVKYSFYIVGQGATERYMLVYAQAYYATEAEAIGAANPSPPVYFDEGVALIAAIICEYGSDTLTILDERPTIHNAANSQTSTNIHGNLLGLLADDHPQYLLVNGSRAMSGNLDMAGSQITSVDRVNGIVVETHASRHLPNGADPITTAAPLVTLSTSSTNFVGTANSLARSDHTHAINISSFSINSLTGTLSVAKGGTGSSTALNNNRLMWSSGGAIVEATALTNGQLFVGSTGVAPVAATLTGTANQVVVTNGAGTITLSLPQNIGTASTPTFASETLTATTNQIVLGTTNTVTINATAPAASRVYTIADPGANANFVMTEGAQTINGVKTFSSPIVGSVSGSAGSVTGVVAIANGGTNSSTALTNNRLMWSSGGAIVEATALTNGQLFVGRTGLAPIAATITGTTNQVAVTNGVGTITLSLPQNINTTATPTFASETLSAVTNQIVLGTTNTATISATAPAASRVYTITDPGANANFMMSEGAQTINGTKTFSSPIVGSVTGTASNVTGVVAIANGGTSSSTALNNGRIMISSGGAIVEAGALTNGQLFVGSTGSAPAATTLTGTANQVVVTNGAGTITLSLPQSIGTASTPTFASMVLSASTNQIVLGTTNTATISATAPAASRTYTIADAGADANFVMSEGTQTINGTMTFTTPIVGDITGSAGTVSGVVPVANGGTGLTSLTAGNFLTGNGSSVLTTKVVPVGTVVGTTDSQTLANKSLVDTTTAFVNVLDSSKKFAVGLGGATTSTTTTLTFAQTANRVVTIPDATDTLVARTTTDTLTNKTIIDSTNNIAANSLKTTGAVVNVAAAAPPTTGQMLTATSATTAAWQNISLSSVSGTLAVSNGGTGKTSVTAGALVYGAGTSALAEITPAANSILVTNGSSVPALSTTLPSAVQSNITTVGTVASGTWNGSAITVQYGGTGRTSVTANALVYGAGTAPMNEVAPAINSILTTNGTGVPVLAVTLPTGVQSNITAVGTVTAGTWNGSVVAVPYGGTGKSSVTVNALVYGAGTSALSEITPTADSILVTNGSSVPALSTTLPAAVQSNIDTVGTITTGVWNGTSIGVAYGGTGKTSVTVNALVYGAGSSPMVEISPTANSILVTNGSSVPALSNTLPAAVQSNITAVGTVSSGVWNGSVVAVAYGGTGKSSVTANALVYGAGTSALTEITPAADSILVTDGSSVPTLSTTLPAAVQSNITAVGTVATGTWNGSAVAVAYGGTGKSSVTANALVYGAGTSALTEITPAANSILITNGSAVPSLATTIPAAVQSNITAVGTVTAGTWNGTAVAVAYGGTGKTSVTANALVYGAGTSALTEVTPAINSILITDGVSTPSLSTTLPTTVQSNITIVGTVVTGTWNGTPIGTSYGGTGLTTYTAGNFLTGNGSSILTTKVVPAGVVVGTTDSQALSNKNLVDNSTFVVGSADATKRLTVLLTGATTATTTTIASSQTVNRTLTLPDATDTLVARTTTDTLTNKTIIDSTNNIAANSLKTTGVIVDVAGAAPPIAGQVLTASSATTATWQSAPLPGSGFNRQFISIGTLTQTNPGASTFVTLFPASGSGTTTFAANSLSVGSTIMFEIYARYSTGTPSPNGQLRLLFGGVTLATSAAVTLTLSKTNIPMLIKGAITVFTNGATGTLIGQAILTTSPTATTISTIPAQMTATAAVDTTIANALDLRFAFSSANASNAFTTTNAIVWLVN